MKQATVWDARGKELSPCPEERARKLVSAGKAVLISETPLIIQLHQAVEIPIRSHQEIEAVPLAGQRTLVHVCCGPCATYTVQRLQQQGALVTGYWYNPNIHPYSEHERRRETLAHYAAQVQLPVIWEIGYEMPAFLRQVVGHEAFRERCCICYRVRLEQTARVAAERGFDLFTTTLLISPYQDQAAIHRIGTELGEQYGIAFYFENLRKGFAEHHHLAEAYGLYRQHYCGCIYSEWEAQDRDAATRSPRF